MRTIIFIIVFACSFLNIDSVSAATSSNGWAFTIDSSAGSVYQKYVYITSSDFYRFRTYNLSQGMDTVLHVYNLNTNQWIGSNDDVANGNCGLNPPYPDSYGSCKVIYINSSTSIMVFVHRYSNSNTGSAVFELKSGAGSGSTIVSETIFPRGDITRTYSGGNKITWAANDTFQYAFKMGGLLYPLVLVAKNTEEPFKWSQSTTPFGSGGIWGQPNILLDSASDSNKNPAYIVGTNSSAQCYFYPSRCGDGTAKYYKNDYLLIDSDSDKIGNGLESALGTNITQADTDGDGIRDDWEVVGGCVFNGCNQSSSDGINLAYYGANPSVKDVFVQIDFMKKSDGADPVNVTEVLQPALQKVTTTFQATQSATEVTKTHVNVFFDYGQLSAGGKGGQRINYQSYLCDVSQIPTECQQSYGSCTQDSQCSSGQKCFEGQCVKFGCHYRCHRYSSYLSPYNIEDIVRGGPGKNFLMQKNRRGVFSHILISPNTVVWYGDETNNFGAITLPNSCPFNALGTNCKTFIPPAIYIRTSLTSAENMAATTFHELGHTFGLAHTPLGITAAFHNIPNHISNMNYYYGGYVDTQQHLDYSSGNRPPLTPFVYQEIECGSQCTSIGGTCLENKCVKGGLDEKVGVGDLFSKSGNNYSQNKQYQLGEMTCMKNSLGYNNGDGPGQIDSEFFLANIDWNKNAVIDISSLVGGHFWEQCAGYYTTEIYSFTDYNEWNHVTSAEGFSRYGTNVLPCMSSYGTPICGSDEGVNCPANCDGTNLVCSYGKCKPQGAIESLESTWVCEL